MQRMNKVILFNRQVISLGIPMLIIFFLVVLAKSSVFIHNTPTLSLAITLDLLLTVPIIYYLLIRKTGIPKTTVVPVMIVGLVAGTYALPAENQFYLSLFKTWVLPVVEISVLTFIVLKLRRALKKYNAYREQTPDFFTTLKVTCAEVFPEKIAPVLAIEIAVIYYGFFNWKKTVLKVNEFTYHYKSGTPITLIVFIFLLIVETSAMHLLLAKWNNTIAWIASGFGMYTIIQLFGFIRSLSQRPISIRNDRLLINYGILAATEIYFKDIASVELSKKRIELDNLTRKLSPLGELESHNIIIRLNKEAVLTGLYGVRKKFTTLLLHVDDKVAFRTILDDKIRNSCEQEPIRSQTSN